MTKLRREKKLIPQEQKGLGDKGRRRFDTRSTAVSEMSPTPTTRPALIFKALSPADSTGPLPSSFATLMGIFVRFQYREIMALPNASRISPSEGSNEGRVEEIR